VSDLRKHAFTYICCNFDLK